MGERAYWHATHSHPCGLVRPVTQRKIEMDIANIPGFPRAIFMNEEPFPKAKIVAWAAQRLDLQLLKSNATVNATRVIIGNNA